MKKYIFLCKVIIQFFVLQQIAFCTTGSNMTTTTARQTTTTVQPTTIAKSTVTTAQGLKIKVTTLTLTKKRSKSVEPNSLAFSSDGEYLRVLNRGLYSISSYAVDQTKKTVKAVGSQVLSLRMCYPAFLANLRDGQIVVANGNQTIVLIKPASSNFSKSKFRILTLPNTDDCNHNTYGLTTDLQSMRCAIAHRSGEVSVYELPTGTTQPILLSPRPLSVNDPNAITTNLAFSSDGRFLAVANGCPSISIFDTQKRYALETGSPISIGNPDNALAQALAYAPDTSVLAVANYSESCVVLFDPANKYAKTILPTGKYPNAVAFSADGKYLAVANVEMSGSSGTISLFVRSQDKKSYAPLSGSPVTVGVNPNCLAFSPNSTMLAVGNNVSGTVSIITGF